MQVENEPFDRVVYDLIGKVNDLVLAVDGCIHFQFYKQNIYDQC